MRRARWMWVALAFAGAAGAQDSPSEVTDGEIAKYKKSAYEACRAPGLKRGDPEAKVDAFCSCMLATLDKGMKRPDWQQAYFYSLKNDNERHNAVVTPHLKDLKHCAQQPPQQSKPESKSK